MTDATTMDIQEQIARIERAQEETRKFVAEQHKLTAEAAKLARDVKFIPANLVVTIMGASAALVGATVAAMKVLGG